AGLRLSQPVEPHGRLRQGDRRYAAAGLLPVRHPLLPFPHQPGPRGPEVEVTSMAEVKEMNRRRRLIHTGPLSAGVLLAALLLVIVNYLGWKYHKRGDWTGSSLYSLSEKSLNVVKGLKKDVRFVVFIPPDQQ